MTISFPTRLSSCLYYRYLMSNHPLAIKIPELIFPLFNLLEMMVLIICTSRICILNNPKDLTYSKRFVVHCHCSILLLYNVVINNGNIHYLAIKYKTDTYLKMLKLKILRLILAQEWGVDTFLESIHSFIYDILFHDAEFKYIGMHYTHT